MEPEFFPSNFGLVFFGPFIMKFTHNVKSIFKLCQKLKNDQIGDARFSSDSTDILHFIGSVPVLRIMTIKLNLVSECCITRPIKLSF